jgi:hypothetical protein
MKALEYCVSEICVRTSKRVWLKQTRTYKLKLLAVMTIIIIIIIIIIILDISFMQGIYPHIPETNHVPREHCVATILM